MMGPQERFIPYYFETVFENLNNMRKNQILTDVTLICGDKKFYAHRSHLSATSQYLYKMFNSGMKETIQDTVDFPSIDSKSLEFILDILYTGKLVTVKSDHLINILTASHLMQLEDIFYHYREIFLSKLSSENFMEHWELGEALDDEIVLAKIYSIVEQIYLEPNFQTVSLERIRKLLSYLSQKAISHDLLLKVIIQWVRGNEEDQVNLLNELIELVDFKKLTTTMLATVAEDPMVNQCDVFKNKCITFTTKRLLFFTNVLQQSISMPSILLFGQDAKTQYILQKCSLGEWDTDIELGDSKTNAAALVTYNSCFVYHVVAAERITENKSEIHFMSFDENGHKGRSNNFGSIPPNSKLVATEFNNLVVAKAYSEHNEDAFMFSGKELIFNSHIFHRFRNIKLQLLASPEGLFLIKQELQFEGAAYLYIFKLHIEYLTYYEMYKVDWTKKSTNWYAYFFPPNIVVRSFPGISVYYNIHNSTARLEWDNNNLTDVVALDLWGHSVWCLTSQGVVYMQDARDGKSDWKAVITSPQPLHRYMQIMIKNA